MKTAFQPAELLLPREGTDLTKWSVVACDQYTSEPDYWEAVDKEVGNAPSTLRLILPELYLESENVAERISEINKTMDAYLSSDIFTEHNNAMLYIERIQSDGRCRAGLVGKLDLEEYDYSKGSTSLVRATEATVLERIPPRKKVREGAPLELPHIMILVDDPDRTVIEPLTAQKNSFQKVYDFKMMQGGGAISGYLLDDAAMNGVNDALIALGQPDVFTNRYSLPADTPVLLYAMGDGNHSLATAKAFYEQLKAEHPGEDLSNHPARYALVEIVNLHSEALEFEAIHRIITGVDPEKLMADMTAALGLTDGNGTQKFTVVDGAANRTVAVTKPTSELTVGSLQQFLDKWLAENGGKIDYIHGADVVERLAAAPDAIGFLLPDMGKDELFPTVIKDGALPRKTFSMGHAADKRFYMECRKIR